MPSRISDVPGTRDSSLTASDPALPGGVLKQGAQGPAVQQLQTALMQLGLISEAQVATGPGKFGPLTLAASLQIDFCTPNAFIQEQSTNVAYHDDNAMYAYTRGIPFAFDAGYVARPDAPGLGVEIDEEKVRAAAATGHRWRNPVWRREDGSVAEW